jgi:signal transduction histidine kinase
MPGRNKTIRWKAPIAITGIYLLFGIAWIVASDHIAALISTSPDQLERLQTYKGTAYVVFTTALVFTLLNLYARRATVALDAVKRKQRELSGLLHQRDQLIRELHHRVRNNMQIVLAILSLSEGEDEARRISRIEMLAMIQDEIYSHPDPRAVEVSTVLSDVIRFLAPAAGEQHVKLEQTLVSCHAPIDVVSLSPGRSSVSPAVSCNSPMSDPKPTGCTRKSPFP